MFFFFNDPATTEIYTLSLHDALPILITNPTGDAFVVDNSTAAITFGGSITDNSGRVVNINEQDRKSTRLNSSHGYISYAVFCLKKKIEHPSRKLPAVRPVTATLSMSP